MNEWCDQEAKRRMRFAVEDVVKWKGLRIGDTVSHDDYTCEDFIVTKIDKINNIIETKGGKNGTWSNPIELIIIKKSKNKRS